MAIIQGQVVDPGGRPVAEAAIYVVSAPVNMPDIAQLTDAAGQFTMSVSAHGRYTIGARSDNWGLAQKDVEVSGDEPVTIKIQFNKLEGEKK